MCMYNVCTLCTVHVQHTLYTYIHTCNIFVYMYIVHTCACTLTVHHDIILTLPYTIHSIYYLQASAKTCGFGSEKMRKCESALFRRTKNVQLNRKNVVFCFVSIVQNTVGAFSFLFISTTHSLTHSLTHFFFGSHTLNYTLTYTRTHE